MFHARVKLYLTNIDVLVIFSMIFGVSDMTKRFSDLSAELCLLAHGRSRQGMA